MEALCYRPVRAVPPPAATIIKEVHRMKEKLRLTQMTTAAG